MAAQSAIGVGAALLGLGEGSAQLANAGYGALIATRFSRTDENEADRIGLELTARSGYDPRAGVTLAENAQGEPRWRPRAGISQFPPSRSQPRPADRVAVADRDAALYGRASAALNRHLHAFRIDLSASQ